MNVYHILNDRRHLAKAFEKRKGKPKGAFWLAFIDGNNIKHVNDTYGHIVGDKVINNIIEVLLNNLRKEDELFRYGGDEFVVLLHDFTKEDCEAWNARISQELNKDEQLVQQVGEMSVSIGFAQFIGQDLESLIDAADKEMYRVKKSTKGIRGFINRLLA